MAISKPNGIIDGGQIEIKNRNENIIRSLDEVANIRQSLKERTLPNGNIIGNTNYGGLYPDYQQRNINQEYEIKMSFFKKDIKDKFWKRLYDNTMKAK